MRNALAVLAVAVAVCLTACSSGGTVDIADSQAADSQTTDYAIAYVKRIDADDDAGQDHGDGAG